MKKKIVFIILIIIWCIVIFGFSNMPSDESNGKSKGTINKVVETTLEITNESGITNKHPSEQKMNSVIDKLNRPLRKCMHASVYFVLSILVYLCLRGFNLKGCKVIIIPIIVAFVYACSDEFHQLFIDGRSSEFTDVLIDTCGAILGVLIINLIFKIIKKRKCVKITKNIEKNV